MPVSTVLTASTDAGHYCRAGAHAYGFTPLGEQLTVRELRSGFHGPNERIDLGRLAISGQFYVNLVRQFQQ